MHARALIGIVSVALFTAMNPASAQVRAPGSDKPLPESAQKAPSFQGGAADVSALVAAVNDLAARVNRLEGHLTQAEVAGAYTVSLYQSALIADASQSVGRLEHLTSSGTLRLEANGTFTLSGTEAGFNALWQPAGARETVNRADTASGTWSYSAAALRLTFDGGGTESWTGGVGGRLFIHAGANPADGTTTLVLLVRNN